MPVACVLNPYLVTGAEFQHLYGHVKLIVAEDVADTQGEGVHAGYLADTSDNAAFS
ncbi:hypothetical protein D3C87_2044950 [compost metagenome]